jgi:chromate transporter
MTDAPAETAPAGTASGHGSPWEVFRIFLRLGLTSFGGPVAHIGYFRAEFVERRRWFDDGAYADLVALCQFMPGPASSQVGLAIGLSRAGALGALAAWTGFTLPSALALALFALGIAAVGGATGAAWLAGLKAVAVAVVAQAVLGMARTLCPDRERATVAVAAATVTLLTPGVAGQIGAILLGAVIGFAALPTRAESAAPAFRVPVSRTVGAVFLGLFLAFLIGLPILAAATDSHALDLLGAFYRAGALVFGGGHVILPLLQAEVVGPGWVDADAFIAGYGAAQAVPGPLFTFSAFLGAAGTAAPAGLVGAALCLVAIFLPSALLVPGLLPFWATLRTYPAARAALAGVNAAVVGLLAAALYDPVFSKGVTGPPTMALALVAFVALHTWKAPPWAVVAAAAALGAALPALGP